MKNIISGISFFLLGYISFAQSEISSTVGYWSDYLPYLNVKHVTFAKDKVYGATDFALIQIDIETKQARRLSRINGLTDIGITALSYNIQNDILFIGYANGNIDLLKNGVITNVSDVLRQSILSSKQINNFTHKGDSVFLATGFGILLIDAKSGLIRETFIIGNNETFVDVNEVYLEGKDIYAATKIGLFKSTIDNPSIRNFQGWTLDISAPSFVNGFDKIGRYNNQLMLVRNANGFRNDTAYVFDNQSNSWQIFELFEGEDIKAIQQNDNNTVMVAYSTSIEVFDEDWQIVRRAFTYGESGSILPNSAEMHPDGTVAIADVFNGLVLNYDVFASEVYNLISPPVPTVSRIFSDKIGTYVAAGFREGDGAGFLEPRFYTYESGIWNDISLKGNEALDTITDIVSVQRVPNKTNEFFATSFIGGLLHYRDGKVINQYNFTNSALSKVSSPGVFYTRTTDLAFDNSDNLWIANSRVNAPLVLKTKDNKWISFDFSELASEPSTGQILIDRNNNKWLILQQAGILVFNENGTFDNTDDDQVRLLTNSENNGNLPSNEVRCIVEDRRGEIWIGTVQGLAVIYGTSRILTEGGAQRVFIEQDGRTSYLLENEVITAICVDGANQKWIGTQNSGVFLMSANGSEEIHHFTRNNSPLFSNNIIDIAVSPENGEVFLATDKGIIGYRGSATEPNESYDDVYAYPNPVNRDYTGIVAIKGLMANSDVRITDIAGNLVHQTFADGGMALWDQNNLSGKRVVPGVYLAYCVTREGTQAIVIKILIQN